MIVTYFACDGPTCSNKAPISDTGKWFSGDVAPVRGVPKSFNVGRFWSEASNHYCSQDCVSKSLSQFMASI